MSEDSKHSDSGDSAVIAGRNPVREALERGERSIEKVMLAQGAGGTAIDQIRRAAKSAGVPVQVVPQQRLEREAPGINHQGAIAVASRIHYRDLDEMLSAIAPDRDAVTELRPVLVALDEIEDPHNFGAILRSAVAAGAKGVIVPERRMAPLSATTVKASAGTADRIPVARVTNLADALLQCKERGYWVAGLDAAGDQTVWEVDWERPTVVVVGSEGRGMRKRVRDVCDFLITIPMRGPVESLNASVAAGVTLFSVVRTRG
jgi:23S rRNA (guanosine2251-2'-O)-methyltransferase